MVFDPAATLARFGPPQIIFVRADGDDEGGPFPVDGTDILPDTFKGGDRERVFAGEGPVSVDIEPAYPDDPQRRIELIVQPPVSVSTRSNALVSWPGSGGKSGILKGWEVLRSPLARRRCWWPLPVAREWAALPARPARVPGKPGCARLLHLRCGPLGADAAQAGLFGSHLAAHPRFRGRPWWFWGGAGGE
tara:strand:+ start:408 stop:980 length:573 start_codon:yes stop_codon:yes gene_type:complete